MGERGRQAALLFGRKFTCTVCGRRVGALPGDRGEPVMRRHLAARTGLHCPGSYALPGGNEGSDKET